MIKHLCVIGVGLIGGSLALALKNARYVEKVTGLGRGLDNLKKAKKLGIIDQFDVDYPKIITDADMIVVCVPIGSMGEVFKKIAPHIKANAIVTDGGSAKQTVIDTARQNLGDKINQFVPAHPIAGTEKSGAEAAFETLYKNRRVIITPLKENAPADIKKVIDMWTESGAQVDTMDALHHDLVLAGTSHLPHVLAFSLVDSLNNVDDVDEIFKYAAGGFRDFTRIASSDPVMWRDICLHNSDAILKMMEHYQNDLDKLKNSIENKNSEELLELFSNAKKVRDDFRM